MLLPPDPSQSVFMEIRVGSLDSLPAENTYLEFLEPEKG